MFFLLSVLDFQPLPWIKHLFISPIILLKIFLNKDSRPPQYSNGGPVRKTADGSFHAECFALTPSGFSDINF